MIKNHTFYILIAFIFIASLMSCEHSPIDLEHTDTDPLSKTWVFSHYDEDQNAQVLVIAETFQWDASGYIFHDDGCLIVRKNAGWCGTPPITYANYEGNWNYVHDTKVFISADYWGTPEGGGRHEYHLNILELTEEKLVVQWEE